MKAEKADRQSRRSRRLITDALFALMLERRYDRITVQEIIDRADVGRSTFYAQFRSKEDVLMSEVGRILDRLHEQHLTSVDEPADQVLPSLSLFRHVAEEQARFRALMRGGGHDLMHQMAYRHLRDRIQRQLATLQAAGYMLTVPPEIVAEYLSGAFVTLIHWWLEQGLTDTPEQMHAIFQQLSLSGVRGVLRPDGVGGGSRVLATPASGCHTG